MDLNVLSTVQGHPSTPGRRHLHVQNCLETKQSFTPKDEKGDSKTERTREGRIDNFRNYLIDSAIVIFVRLKASVVFAFLAWILGEVL